MDKAEKSAISFFERNLTYWVALCMVIGVLIGKFMPAIPKLLAKFEYANVSIPIAVLIWLMIYPMMMKVDFASVKNVGKNPKGLFVTWVVNWLIKPFTMFGIAAFFFYVVFKPWISPELAKDYLAGAVLLGAAPCTAMVFVWSHLTRGNAAYTVVQVATNDLIILIAFTPIVAFLLGIGGITIPWMTLIVSVVLFVVVPLVGGVLTRNLVIRSKGEEYFQNAFIPKFNSITIAGLLLTLVLIFSFQGEVIINNPLHIVLIAVPLIIQTVLIFFLAYGACYRLHCRHDIAAPAGMIGASNFFELSVAVAITLFGASSPVVLATIVGVLVEVPVMLALVSYANRTSASFSKFETSGQGLKRCEDTRQARHSWFAIVSRAGQRSLRACDHSLRLPLLAVRLRRLGDSLPGTQGNAEAVVESPERRADPTPKRRPATRGPGGPTAATDHAVRALFWSSRIADGTLGVVTVPVAAPFPDVPVHVV